MADQFIFGRRAIVEALTAAVPLRQILLAEGSKPNQLRDLLSLAEKSGVRVRYVARHELTRRAQTDKHQGALAVMPAFAYQDIEEVLARMAARTAAEKPCLLLLDSIEDPRNLGAIIRVADGAGINAVAITKRRCAEVTAAAIKTSAGAAFHLPVVQVTNLVSLMKKLKEKGIWIAGLDASGSSTVYDLDASLPLAIVLGSEGKGLHRLVRENCDFLVKIPMKGKVDSLNVAAATAVVCYEVVRQRLL